MHGARMSLRRLSRGDVVTSLVTCASLAPHESAFASARGIAWTAVPCSKPRETLPTPPTPADVEHGLPAYDTPDVPVVADIVHKRGQDVLNDPLFNRGTAFLPCERERLGLRGLLPPKQSSLDSQVARFLELYHHGAEKKAPPPDASITVQAIRKWLTLSSLQDRNETLFYRVLIDRFEEMAPIVYTPTVGWACINYSTLYRRPRGMFFTARDRGQMASMLFNWQQMDVDAIVVTDGSRILGLGDLGVNGLGIPIGKLDLYVAAAGFHPHRVLPCVIDVGTDNESLLADPAYMGLHQRRLKGPEYLEVVDEFVRAVTSRWPRAVLQFEDFSTDVASMLLERYRSHHLVFNDDIQGTAATALAGIYGGLRVLDQPASDIVNQRIVCAGAGSAGMGVLNMVVQAMMRHGMSEEDARRNIWVLDKDGLVTVDRGGVAPHVRGFARREPGIGGMNLLDTVRMAKPTMLLGLTGAGRVFTQQVLAAAAEGCASPLVFPMSNPTSKMECTAEEAAAATQGRAIFASGSPQDDVEYGGRRIASSQANNMVIFPGLALGAHLAGAKLVTDDMIMAAAEAVPNLIPTDVLQRGGVYPHVRNIREISMHVALAVVKQAAEEGLVENSKLLRKIGMGDAAALAYIKRSMYHPSYNNIVSLPAGIME
ncbi:unnamed protein product [Pedinophyceae sp. YPF-701]|nr:unnamed protein product [Pedinophyceae sp. YPF-701]